MADKLKTILVNARAIRQLIQQVGEDLGDLTPAIMPLAPAPGWKQ